MQFFDSIMRHLRRLLRSKGFDVVRYRPVWSRTLGLERLNVGTVLDIGAHDGATARLFRQFYPKAVIYCFEPQSDLAGRLEDWAQSQEGRVRVFPFALGNRSGMIDMIHYPDMQVCSSCLTLDPVWGDNQPFLKNRTTLQVPVCRLDEALDGLTLPEPILIKVDTEGFEREVILGGSQVFSRATACILEVNLKQRFIGQPDLAELNALLVENGLVYAGNLLQAEDKSPGALYIDALWINPQRIPGDF